MHLSALRPRRSLPSKLAAWAAGLFAVLAFTVLVSGQRPLGGQPPVLQLKGAKYVRGYLAARVGGAQDPTPSTLVLPSREIFVPGVKVTLVTTGGTKVGTVVTDLSGRFNFGPQKAGKYKLCWQRAGFRSECLSKTLTAVSRPINIGTLPIRPDIDGKRKVSVWGEVQRRDGDLTRLFEPVADMNRFATVEAIDGTGRTFDRVPVNNFGEYIVPAVAVNQKALFKLAAVIENGRTERGIHGRRLATRAQHRVDIEMRNRAPVIGDLVSSVAGIDTLTPRPGEIVNLSIDAPDPDGDPVEVSWTLEGGGGGLSASTGTAVAWELPGTPGAYTVYAVASDGKGGYDKTKLTLNVGQDSTSFSGRVADRAGNPLGAVRVEVNGKATKTDARGYFEIAVEPRERYVLNLTKWGFALVSHVYRSGISAGRWAMTPVTVASANPTLDIRVQDDSRKKVGCAVPASTEIDWKIFGQRIRPRVQDGKGNIVGISKENPRPPLPRQVLEQRRRRECGPGTQVVIPANSLVDKNGNPPPPGTNVEVAVGTVDLLDPDSMPGDYTSTDGSSTPQWMISYGAGSVEIAAGGKSYNLKPGATAKLRIPVADVQLAAGGAIPPTIPRLVYVPSSGVWKAEGVLKLDPTGRFYEADVKHFSVINADVQKQGQSCVRFKSEDLPVPFRVEVVVPLGAGQAPRVRDEQIPANDVYWAIINLPNDTEITLTAYQPQPGGGIPYGVFTVNTGGPQNGAATAPNYFACEAKVVLREVEAPVPGEDAFLHGLYSFFATNLGELAGDVDLNQPLVEATIDYYGAIDPRGLRRNFTEFKDANGFDAEGDLPPQANYGDQDEVRASYANAVDLGFGRDMHGKRTLADDGDNDIAFYVSNYGDYDSDDEGDFENATDQDPTELVATVAMEWSRIEDPPAIPFNAFDPDAGADPNDPNAPITFGDPERVIKFYVYNAAGNPVFFANLDTRGQRPIPQLCMVCHGGVYPSGPNVGVPGFSTPDDVKLGSVMLPFDLHGYVLTGAVPPDFTKAQQQLEFSQLNAMVVDTEPGEVTEELISEWYDADPDLQAENVVVPGWDLNNAHREMYLSVIKPACRVCHSSRPLEDDGLGHLKDIRMHQATPWLTRTDEGGIASLANTRVCAQRVMPHAFATYNRFWGSFDVGQPAIFPFQPARFKAFLDGVVEPALAALGQNLSLGGLCAPPADPDDDLLDPPVTLGDVQIILDNNGCSGCHANPPNFTQIDMDLNAGLTHGTTVGVNAQELLNNRKRIVAGNSGLSYLVNKISGDLNGLPCSDQPAPGGVDCGDPMPPPNGASDADQADIIQWIADGAQNN